MNREVYSNGQLVERWDATLRTYTAYGLTGEPPEWGVTETRPFTTEENAQADAWLAKQVKETNKSTIQQQAEQALFDNRNFIASTPTQATAIAQTKALSRQVNGIIRLLLDKLDGTD